MNPLVLTSSKVQRTIHRMKATKTTAKSSMSAIAKIANAATRSAAIEAAAHGLPITGMVDGKLTTLTAEVFLRTTGKRLERQAA